MSAKKIIQPMVILTFAIFSSACGGTALVQPTPTPTTEFTRALTLTRTYTPRQTPTHTFPPTMMTSYTPTDTFTPTLSPIPIPLPSRTITAGNAAALGEWARLSKGLLWSIAFSPDGKMLASGSLDGTISLWGIIGPA